MNKDTSLFKRPEVRVLISHVQHSASRMAFHHNISAVPRSNDDSCLSPFMITPHYLFTYLSLTIHGCSRGYRSVTITITVVISSSIVAFGC